MGKVEFFTVIDVHLGMSYTYDTINGIAPLMKIKTGIVPPTIWNGNANGLRSYITVESGNPHTVATPPHGEFMGNVPDFAIIYTGGDAIHLHNPTINPVDYLFDNKVPLDEKFLYEVYKHTVPFLNMNTKYYVDKTGLHPSVSSYYKSTDIVGGKVAWFDVTLAEPTTSVKASLSIEKGMSEEDLY